MALNIKDRETEQLAAEIAAMTGESTLRAVKVALQERKERLEFRVVRHDRTQELRCFLEEEVWPQIPPRRTRQGNDPTGARGHPRVRPLRRVIVDSSAIIAIATDEPFSHRDRDDSAVATARRSGRRVIDRRTLLRMLAVGACAVPPLAQAQTAGKLPRLGVLSVGTPDTHRVRIDALRQGLRELGYVEGQNILIEYRYADGKTERLLPLAEELVGLKVEVIVTSGDQAIRAAKQASPTIPIVVALTGDLVGPGHVVSLAKPGGNVTGLTVLVSELSGKRLELLKAAFPHVSRIAVLWNPDNAGNAVGMKEMDTAAATLGVRLVSSPARKPADLEGAFQMIRRERADGLAAHGDLMLLGQRARIVAFAAKQRLPAIYGNQDYMDVGALMSYAPNVADLFRRAATYVDKILKGARPADLPVEQATRVELVINVKTAKALGLTLPQRRCCCEPIG